MKRLLLGIAAAACLTTQASAQDYISAADPQVVQALNEIVMALNNGCASGNVGACQAAQYAQTGAQFMLTHSYQCQYDGNQQACGQYRQDMVELRTSYAQVQQAHMSGTLYQPTAPAGGMGLSHADRMQQIHDMGVANTRRFNQRIATMDARHNAFLDMIRQ